MKNQREGYLNLHYPDPPTINVSNIRQMHDVVINAHYARFACDNVETSEQYTDGKFGMSVFIYRTADKEMNVHLLQVLLRLQMLETTMNSKMPLGARYGDRNADYGYCVFISDENLAKSHVPEIVKCGIRSAAGRKLYALSFYRNPEKYGFSLEQVTAQNPPKHLLGMFHKPGPTAIELLCKVPFIGPRLAMFSKEYISK